MQGIHGWIGSFDIVFAAYCCVGFVPASFVFYITFILVSDRGFKCRLHYVVFIGVRALSDLGGRCPFCPKKLHSARMLYC